jgi:hypothetical protein
VIVDDADPLPATRQLCSHCGGGGMLYTSRYGGNDRDVWPTGECPVCDGTSYELIETEEVVDDNSCPGHVASPDNPKVCGRCGIHIDELRPEDE